MAVWQGRSTRKETGGRYRQYRKKKKNELGSEPVHTKMGKTKRKIVRTLGGSSKAKILSAEFINLYDPNTKTTKKAKIITVKENPANPHYVQRNIMTKGAVVQTDLGLARITSKPGQHGVINGVLVQ